jgi:hypothetical protein
MRFFFNFWIGYFSVFKLHIKRDDQFWLEEGVKSFQGTPRDSSKGHAEFCLILQKRTSHHNVSARTKMWLFILF